LGAGLDIGVTKDLRPKDWANSNDEVLASAIYLEETKEGLAYRARGLDAEVRQGVIAHDQLAKKFQKLVAEITVRGDDLKQLPKEFPKSVDAIIKEKLLLSPLILELVAEAGYIYTAEGVELLKTQSEAVVKAVKDEKEEAFNAAYSKLQATIELQKTQSDAIVQAALKAAKEEKEELVVEANSKPQATIETIILQKPINFDLLKALYRLRNHLEPKGNSIGHHFNPQLLLEAYQKYDANFDDFGCNWYNPKNVFCWQKIVGLAQRLLPGCDAQVIAQGIYSVMTNGYKSRQSFSFTFGGGSIFPLDSDAAFRLGYNYSCDSCDAGVGREGCRSALGKLISSKNISAAKLMLQPGKQPSWGCAIM
jgi:hypothetical protein